MKKFIALSLTMFFAIAMNAQDAEKILKDLSEKAKTFKTVKATYTYRLIDSMSGLDESSEGEITIKDEKYHLDTGDYLIISDGTSQWTYQRDVNEVLIDDMEDLGDDGFDPKTMFTIWEDDFNYALKGSVNMEGVDCWEIHLYPNNSEDKTFHTIKMFVDKKKMEVFRLEVKGREGTDVIYKMKTFQTDQAVPDSKFQFNEGDFPGVEIIDNRL
ncbi:MAG: outer membrane lipoprotein carrier protein LolA [Bacteroidota bacterium]